MSKFAVVTGANRGIGSVTSAALIKDGWTVALLGRDITSHEATPKDLGPTATPIACDVSDPQSVAKAFQQVNGGEVDIGRCRDLGDTCTPWGHYLNYYDPLRII